MLQDQDAIPDLIDVLSRAHDIKIKRAALTALAMLPSEKSRPLYAQYWHYINQLVVHQSLGYSFGNRQAVNSIISQAAPVTAAVVFGGAFLWMLVAIPVGIYSAVGQRLVRSFSRHLATIPNRRS